MNDLSNRGWWEEERGGGGEGGGGGVITWYSRIQTCWNTSDRISPQFSAILILCTFLLPDISNLKSYLLLEFINNNNNSYDDDGDDNDKSESESE